MWPNQDSGLVASKFAVDIELQSNLFCKQNYNSCFVDDGSAKLADISDDPYEIMNGSDKASAITFKHKHNFGIYVFTVVVVDQEFRFLHFP